MTVTLTLSTSGWLLYSVVNRFVASHAGGRAAGGWGGGGVRADPAGGAGGRGEGSRGAGVRVAAEHVVAHHGGRWRCMCRPSSWVRAWVLVCVGVAPQHARMLHVWIVCQPAWPLAKPCREGKARPHYCASCLLASTPLRVLCTKPASAPTVTWCCNPSLLPLRPLLHRRLPSRLAPRSAAAPRTPCPAPSRSRTPACCCTARARRPSRTTRRRTPPSYGTCCVRQVCGRVCGRAGRVSKRGSSGCRRCGDVLCVAVSMCEHEHSVANARLCEQGHGPALHTALLRR